MSEASHELNTNAIDQGNTQSLDAQVTNMERVMILRAVPNRVID